MTVRHVIGVLAAAVFTFGAAIVVPTYVRAQGLAGLPPEGGMVTLVGCFQPGGKHHSKYVLAKPSIGEATSVPDGTCSAPLDADAVELKDTGDRHLGEGLLNHVIEVTGRLEKIEGTVDEKDLRELHVRSFRPVPVVVPMPVAAAPVTIIQPAPAPQPEAAAPLPAAEQPVATSGTMEKKALPKTASPLPLVGALSLMSLVTALLLHVVGRRREEIE